jgi:hypothetical protein
MEVQALTRNARMSPKKVREVARTHPGPPRHRGRSTSRILRSSRASPPASSSRRSRAPSRTPRTTTTSRPTQLTVQAPSSRTVPCSSASRPAPGHGHAAPQEDVAHPHRPLRRQNQLTYFTMGQKTNPTGFRLAVRRNWQSRWFARKKDFAKLLLEDQIIRTKLMEKLKQASVPRIFIERAGNRVRVKIYTARPGIVIGARARSREDQGRARQAHRQGRSSSTSRKSRSPRSRPSSWPRTSPSSLSAASPSAAP